MSKFATNTKFATKPGQQDKLAAILLEAAKGLETFKGCEQYIVLVSETEADAVWVTEIWSDAAAHQASLQLEETRAAISKAMPLIAGIESAKLTPLGGKGL